MILKDVFTLIAVLFASFAIWIGAVQLSHQLDTYNHLGFGIAVSAATLLLFIIVLRWIDKKPLSFLFGNGQALPSFFKGVAYFAIPALAALAVAAFFGLITVTPLDSPSSLISTLLLVLFLVFISEALPEEIVFRGYIFKKLSSYLQQWAVISIQATFFLLFALVIGSATDPLNISFLLIFALTLGMLRSVTGSTWAAIGFHLTCMTFQQAVGSQWGIFAVSNPSILQTFIFGIIPFSVTVGIIFTSVQWRKRKA